MEKLYNLQLRHGAEGKNFSTREDVFAYIDGQLLYGGVKLLPYEPVLFYYGDGENKNTIIMVGLPDGMKHDGKEYFIVDTTALKETLDEIEDKYDKEIEGLKSKDEELDKAIKEESKAREEADNEEKDAREKADEELQKNIDEESKAREEADNEEKDAREKADEKLQSGLDFSKDDIKSVIDACGLLYNEKLAEDRVKYEPDRHDETIRDAESISDAVDKISKFATKMAKDLKVSVADTETVGLAMSENEKDGGNTITANVKLSEGGSITGKTQDDDNILSIQKDGLFATVDLSYEEHTHVLTFRKSDSKNSDGVEKTFNLGGHTEYKADNEGHTVKVAVVTNGDNGTISGDVEVSTDTHNKLEVKDNKLFVDDRAKSILVDEEGKVTLDKKLETIDKAVADNTKSVSDNKKSIDTEVETARAAEEALVLAIENETDRAKKAEVANKEAIEAEIKAARAAEKENADAIAIINSSVETKGSIKNALAEAKEYSDTVSATAKKEAIEHSDQITNSIEVVKNGASDLQYILYVNKEKRGTIDIPKDQFLKDATYNKKSKELTLEFITKDSDGKKVVIDISDLVDTYEAGNGLSLKEGKFYVKIDSDSEYLTVSDEGIKVKGIDAAIKNETTRAKEAEEKLDDAIKAEAKRAEKAEKANADAIAEEAKTARRAEKDNADAIATISGEATVDGSIKKALKDAKEYADTVATNAKDTAIADAKEKLDFENKRAEKAEKANADAILAEQNRAKEAEKANATAIEKETQRASEKETDILEKVDANTKNISVNTKAITDEVGRAKDAEAILRQGVSENKTAIEKEIKDARDAEAAIEKKADANTTTIATANKAIAQLDKDLQTEVTRSSEIDTKHTKAIEDNKTAIDGTIKVANKAAADIAEEVTRATGAEKTIDDKVTVNTKGVAAVTELANNINTALTGEITRAKSAEVGLNTAITKEIGDARAAEKVLDGKIDGVSKSLADTKVELNADINKKANAVDVFTKAEIGTTLEPYAKTADVQEKLNAKANTVEVANVYATKADLQGVKDTYATANSVTTSVSRLDERITANKGAIDNFGLAYNEATSELTYTNKDGNQTTYKLYSGSLIKKGEFDKASNSIVLTYENVGKEYKISIPVSALLSDIDGRVTVNEGAISNINTKLATLSKDWGVDATSTVTLTKNTTGEKDSLTAAVRIATSDKQAIQSKGDGLYVSNDLENYTVVYGDEVISGQSAIAKLKEATSSLSGEITNKISDAVKAEKERAEGAEKANAKAIAAEKERAEQIEATKANVTDVFTKADVNNLVTPLATKADVETSKNALTEFIDKKADATSVYTKEDILKLLEIYAKNTDVNSKLAVKANSADVANVYATKEALSESAKATDVKETTDKISESVKANKVAIDNFGLAYNPATSTLTFTGKDGKSVEYKLYSGSLIKKGEFDEKTNSVVLTIETAGQESQITIPVKDLLSGVTDDVKKNASDIGQIKTDLGKLSKAWEAKSSPTVTLTKVTGETDSLTATVRVASSNKQAIQNNDNGLYVSNDLEDYTVVFGEEGTISGQTAISKLLVSTTSLNTTVSTHTTEISSIKSDITNLGGRITNVESSVQNLTTKVTNAETSITEINKTIGGIQNDITNINTKIGSLETKVTTLENNYKTLSEKVENIEQKIEKTIQDVINNYFKDNADKLIPVSKKEDNSISFENDGLYSKKISEVAISKDADNIIKQNTDGLYAAATKAEDLAKEAINLVSKTEGNLIEAKSDGLYVSNELDEGEY